MPLVNPDAIWLPKAVVQGGLTALGACAIVGKRTWARLPIVDSAVPVWALSIGLGICGSLVADGTHNFVRGQVHLSRKYRDEASMVVGALMSAGLYTGGLYLCNPQLPFEYGMWNAMAVGGGAEIASAISVGALNEAL